MSEVIASGIIEAGTLKTWVDTMTALVQEARLHFNDDGLSVRVVDPANVAVYHPNALNRAAFESFDSPGSATVGIDLNRLSDRLGSASSGDLVELSLDMETRKLNVQYGPVNHTVALIDPDTVRKEPDFPDLDLPNTLTITGSDWQTVVTNANMVSDHVDIRGVPDDKCVKFVADGDTDDVTITYGQDEVRDPTEINEKCETTLSLDYLGDVAPTMPKKGDVTVEFGEEFPAIFEWENAEGYHTVTYMQAPRIKQD